MNRIYQTGWGQNGMGSPIKRPCQVNKTSPSQKHTFFAGYTRDPALDVAIGSFLHPTFLYLFGYRIISAPVTHQDQGTERRKNAPLFSTPGGNAAPKNPRFLAMFNRQFTSTVGSLCPNPRDSWQRQTVLISSFPLDINLYWA